VSNAAFDINFLTNRTLLVLPDINDSGLELPGGNLTVEQDIEFTVGAALELRKAEVRGHEADTGCASPDVTALASQIPAGGVEHLRREEDHGDLGNVVGGATHTGAQSTEANGRRLGDDGVGDGSEGSGVHEGDDDAETGLGVVGIDVLGDRRADTEEEEQGDVCRCAPQVDSSAAEPGGQRPRETVGHQLEAGVDQVEFEREVSRHSSLCISLVI
jgi:hypothetical protein